MTEVLSVLTIIAQIEIVILLILMYLNRKKKSKLFKKIIKISDMYAFLIAIISTLGSLYYSEIVGFEPCSLCWWQRVFIYPQAIFLGIAYFKKEFQHSSLYAIVLSIIGGVIGIYQNALYYGAPQIGACDGSATAVSCTKLYILEFGYITIPIMSLTAFLLIIFFLNLARKSK